MNEKIPYHIGQALDAFEEINKNHGWTLNLTIENINELPQMLWKMDTYNRKIEHHSCEIERIYKKMEGKK